MKELSKFYKDFIRRIKMKPRDGIKERMVEKNDIGDDKESEGIEQFIIIAERQSWQEVTDIIAEKGFIKGIKI